LISPRYILCDIIFFAKSASCNHEAIVAANLYVAFFGCFGGASLPVTDHLARGGKEHANVINLKTRVRRHADFLGKNRAADSLAEDSSSNKQRSYYSKHFFKSIFQAEAYDLRGCGKVKAEVVVPENTVP
jgi:hypothetical protein